MKQLLVVFLVFTSSILLANHSTEGGIVRGQVIEEATGESVIAATVLVKQTGSGAITDLDGKFTLNLTPGTYSIEISYVGFQPLIIDSVQVDEGEVTLLENIRIKEEQTELEAVVITAEAIRTTEAALMTIKKKSPVMLDGISSAKFRLTGDATAVEAAKRVTGVSIEGGKYVYVRGLGDRYSKTTLNGVDIPGLDPDRNTIQMDIFPTNLIDNIVVSKNFTADMPADFAGGLLNIETKDFPEEKILSVSAGISYNPGMHFNSDYLTYDGGGTDFLGFDDGTRELPNAALLENIPSPVNGFTGQQVSDFNNSFNSQLGALRQTSFMDYGFGFTLGDQKSLNPESEKDPKLGYIFTLSYKSDFRYYDEAFYGSYQRFEDPTQLELRYAGTQEGELGEHNVLLSGLAGLAYKTNFTKLRLMAMRLQNGESRAGKFFIDDSPDAVGSSGFFANSDNLEYNQRSLTNVLLHGEHVLNQGQGGWEIDWRLSPTISTSEDPDLRRTVFSEQGTAETKFDPGAGGNPKRIWRSLSQTNLAGKIDISKKYNFRGRVAKLRFGVSHTYKQRDYEILEFDIQFFFNQDWPEPDPTIVHQPENFYPNSPNGLYYSSGNTNPNANAYESSVNNTGFYISNEFEPFTNLKAIFGVRAENFVQRHTGRDRIFPTNPTQGRELNNEEVLNSLDFFPTANFIYSVTDNQNIRASYGRTIARPSFKELSFAQILDPVSNRFFNGSLFTYEDWDGNLRETYINNVDVRWELFLERDQLISVSAFYKNFESPIEIVRIAAAQTIVEVQPRNVGNGTLYGLEFEFRKNLDFISQNLRNFQISGNLTLVESFIDMTESEFRVRKNFEREGETIEDTRQMAGQSPYVINTGFTYNNYELGLDAGLFYNVKGSTLMVIGNGLAPDVSSEPFHSLNFSISKKLGEKQNTAITLKVANILNDKRESFFRSFEAEAQLFDRFNPGTSFGLSINHKF